MPQIGPTELVVCFGVILPVLIIVGIIHELLQNDKPKEGEIKSKKNKTTLKELLLYSALAVFFVVAVRILLSFTQLLNWFGQFRYEQLLKQLFY